MFFVFFLNEEWLSHECSESSLFKGEMVYFYPWLNVWLVSLRSQCHGHLSCFLFLLQEVCRPRVLIFCVEFRELSQFTYDLSQAEKKINDVTSWTNPQNDIYFTHCAGSNGMTYTQWLCPAQSREAITCKLHYSLLLCI